MLVCSVSGAALCQWSSGLCGSGIIVWIPFVTRGMTNVVRAGVGGCVVAVVCVGVGRDFERGVVCLWRSRVLQPSGF